MGGTRVSRWETSSALTADVPVSAVWEGAYADATVWPGRRRTLPDAQRAVVELAGGGR
jgi:hypothetical protein